MVRMGGNSMMVPLEMLLPSVVGTDFDPVPAFIDPLTECNFSGAEKKHLLCLVLIMICGTWEFHLFEIISILIMN